jgi:hypothetical protein
MYDASLDQFATHSWYFPNLFRTLTTISWDGNFGVSRGESRSGNEYREFQDNPQKTYDNLLWNSDHGVLSSLSRRKDSDALLMANAVSTDSSFAMKESVTGSAQKAKEDDAKPKQESITPRKNFVETAFFFPDLKTDA